MAVKKESGRRFVEVEAEVPGKPDDVWRAIATGPGVSSWFVPTKLEYGEGGAPVKVISDFGPGMESVATVTAWDPPRRFAAESAGLGPGAPPMATEWIVESRGGGTCIVRVVHSLFTSSDEWDDQLTSIENGWPFFFRILRLHLKHFHNQQAATFQVMGVGPEPAKAWEAFTRALGFGEIKEGKPLTTSGGTPPLSGVVEWTNVGKPDHAVLLRLERPQTGVASIFAMPMGGQTLLRVDMFLYGDNAPATAASAKSAWQAWMSERFAPVENASGACG